MIDLPPDHISDEDRIWGALSDLATKAAVAKNDRNVSAASRDREALIKRLCDMINAYFRE